MQRVEDDDGDTCGGRVSGTRPVETAEVWKEWREALGGRTVSKKKKEEEEEGDLLGAFFYRIYEFLFSFSNPPSIVHRPRVPARYTIKFIPALSSDVSAVIPLRDADSVNSDFSAFLLFLLPISPSRLLLLVLVQASYVL